MKEENIFNARGMSRELDYPLKGSREGEWGNDNFEDEFPAREMPHRDIVDFFVDYMCKENQIVMKDLLCRIEKGLISKALRAAQGNQKQAARILGIKYTTLNVKIKKHRIKIMKILSA